MPDLILMDPPSSFAMAQPHISTANILYLGVSYMASKFAKLLKLCLNIKEIHHHSLLWSLSVANLLKLRSSLLNKQTSYNRTASHPNNNNDYQIT